MKTVYRLTIRDDDGDVVLANFYSTRKKAEKAIEEIKEEHDINIPDENIDIDELEVN